MKLRFVLVLLSVCFLSGCSLFDNINNSLNYVEEATSYIHDVSQFGDQIPALAEQAAADPQVRTTLKSELENMKENIENFNGIEAPAYAKEIHQQLVGYNETLMKEINGYLEKINNEVIDWKTITNSQMVETIEKITGILTQIQNISQ